jgi:Outer membrane protein
MLFRKYVGVIGLFLVSVAYGQTDTLSLTLKQADSLFLTRNLSLLAQKYNISENEANVIQAKIWDLPNVTINHNLYNPQTNKYLEISSASETMVQLQQLILIGGKRSKLVSMARTNLQSSQYQYQDLCRNLKYQLRSAFYNVYFTSQKLQIYETEVPLLKQVVTGYETMYPKGFVSLKDVVRLKALLFSLENDRLDLIKQLNNSEDTLRLMLNERTARFIKPLSDTQVFDSLDIKKLSLQALLDSASHNRADLLYYQAQSAFAKTDLSYQKSLNIPDPSFIIGWDHNGGFVKNYNYVGLNFDLPAWNKNRGNIKAAAAREDLAKANYDNYQLQVNLQVEQALKRALETDKLYNNAGTGFGDDFTRIIHAATDNFVKHQLGLLEFVDLYESYKESQTSLIQLRNDRIDAIENLSFTIGKPIN